MGTKSGRRELASLVEDVAEQLGMIRVDADQLGADCTRLRTLISAPLSKSDRKHLKSIVEALAGSDIRSGGPVLELLAGLKTDLPEPGVLLAPLLEAEDQDLALAGTRLLLEAARAQDLPLDRDLLRRLAKMASAQEDPEAPADSDPLTMLAEALGTDRRTRRRLEDQFIAETEPGIRLLLAAVLDRGGEPASGAVMRALLPGMAAKVLAPYLNYTRATHRDLTALTVGGKVSPDLVAAVREAEAIWGKALLLQLVGLLGWERLNGGLHIIHRVEMTLPGYPPVMAAEAEADLLMRSGGARRGAERLVAVAWGTVLGGGSEMEPDSGAADPVDRFRRLNTNHADLLGVILDVAPLDPAKVRRILAAMDSIVADYGELFADSSAECGILPDVYAGLKRRVVAELDKSRQGSPLSAELTRLVLMFEDPANLGEVRTLHGLKRYLHQKGLRFGSGLVDASRTPARTVDLVLVDRRGRLLRTPTIGFAEFEPTAEVAGDLALPYPIRLIAEAWTRQLLYGRTSFPEVNAFLFGNEVQCYLFFRNHPVFLRLDFSPPQRGGMIDLEYYGVSNYELDVHPDLELEAIRRIFADLGFDASLEGTRLHARYDKERCPDLGDLCRRMQALLRLGPYLMDVDWQIGSLAYPPDSRRLVAEAWSRRFAESGVLPQRGILTADGRGILAGHAPGPTGQVEQRWNGHPPYADRHTGPPPAGFLAALRGEMAAAGLTPPPVFPGEDRRGVGLDLLEREFLAPLRLAGAARDHRHEAERFARLLLAGGRGAERALALAVPAAEAARHAEFTQTGAIGPLKVERAVLPVRGGRLAVSVLKDVHGLARMALAEEWSEPAGTVIGLADPARLWALLRGANYVTGKAPVGPAGQEVSLDDLQDLALRAGSGSARRRDEQEVVLDGVKAAPGRAVGRAVFGSQGRRAEDLRGAVLVAAELQPEDAPLLAACAGVVCTGGAVLSHAALLAIQHRKPALLVSAELELGRGQPGALHFAAAVHRERTIKVGPLVVGLRDVVGRRTDRLLEGDLVLVDADDGAAVVLGQERDTLALHEGLRSLAEAAARSDAAGSDHDSLTPRALHLKARHQVGKVLDRLSDPVAAGFFLEEILAAETLAQVPAGDKAQLLERLLANPVVGSRMSGRVPEVVARLERRAGAALNEAILRLPDAALLAEVLGLRLQACRRLEALAACRSVVGPEEGWVLPDRGEMDRRAVASLRAIRKAAGKDLEALAGTRPVPARARHLLRIRRRCERVLGEEGPEAGDPWPDRIARSDEAAVRRHRESLVLGDRACGFPLHALVGWKAANLGEMVRLCGKGQCPPWFAVTDRALGIMLDQPLAGGTLRQAIAAVLDDQALDQRRRSTRIQALWRQTPLPGRLAAEVQAAYAGLGGHEGEIPVAIRSSSCDEDTEAAMRAGEFETYLNITGFAAVLDHLRLTWAGLWSEQALHARAGDPRGPAWPRGGLIVQRLVDSRVSGVVQTINVARGDPGEMVINAGLGQGAGIVSGQCAADLVTVVKAGHRRENPVIFNYITNDKPKQAVRDGRPGGGVRLVDTLYHQRLRPALEYIELVELVDRVLALETAYGYPLDLEFAIEDHQLWLLQARPIASCAAEWHETLNRHPLAAAGARLRLPQPGAEQ